MYPPQERCAMANLKGIGYRVRVNGGISDKRTPFGHEHLVRLGYWQLLNF